MICPRCYEEREEDQFPLLSMNPQSACVECLREGIGLDSLAQFVGTPEQQEVFRYIEQQAAIGKAAGAVVDREFNAAVRELRLRRKKMSVAEAEAWATAWLALSRPSAIEPWVYMESLRGAKYDENSRSIIPAA